ncbi:MAG TPA: DUF885 domain-containing protein [Terriglobia bacterium]|nr:DUF885 domain-containing protein [Terriglobia bacterium]
MDRRDMLRTGLAMTAAGLVPGRAGAGPAPETAPPEETAVAEETKALHDLFAAEWDYTMERHPTWASSLGDRRWNDRWEDASLSAIRADHEHERRVMDRLKTIDRARLSRQDQLNYDLFKKDYEISLEEYPYHWYLVPLNQRGGIQTVGDDLTESLRFETVKDYEDWIARCRAFPDLMDQTIALMREGIRERMLLPKVIMQRIPAQISKQVTSDPTESSFYRPFQRFADSIPEAARARLAPEAKQAIASSVVPAYQRFDKFFSGEYLPACFDQVGIWQVPNGAALYAFFVRRFTTTNLTPDEVHQLGLKEVERIHAEMQGVLKETGFKGSMPEFFNFLRTDPQFFIPDAGELLKTYRATAKRIDPHLVKVFRTLPRMPYGVEPIPAAAAPDTTAAYYSQGAADGSRAGTYYVNLYKPETRPKWEMLVLSLHESVPGHHVQIALGMEQGQLPNFRRYGYYNAFGEGWGLYAESLGYEMGLYGDPYSKFGQLTYDMWRAVRLVVDTGMHVMHWDRQRAIDYFTSNAPRPELDIVNEIDRYIAWPGQALSYKIGQLKIKELREKSAQALGGKFDLREYHEVVLRDGSLPLDILERNVNEWLASAKG